MSFSSLLTSIMNREACHLVLLNPTDPTVTPSSESSLSIEHLTLVNANVLDDIASTFVTTFFKLLVFCYILSISTIFNLTSFQHSFKASSCIYKAKKPTLLPAAGPLAGRSFQLFEFQGSAAIQINPLKNLESQREI